jgi:hypothetical protein
VAEVSKPINPINKFAGTSIIPCRQCAFFLFEERGATGKQIGFCRLDPPVVVVVNYTEIKTVLPVVSPDRDGCGQGELLEEFVGV